jgi:O-antigen/teichoic acid export membrane protein
MSPYRPRLTLRQWRRIVGFSFWVWMSNLVAMLWDRIDTVVIGRLLGATAVGIFAIGWEVGSLPLNELVLPLNRVLFSGFSEANRSGHAAAQVYVRASAAAVLVTLPAGVGISLVADPLIRLGMGEQWLRAVPLIQILAIAGAIAAPSFLAEAFFRAEGRPSVNFHIGAVVACVKALACVALVLAFGLKGGAVALTLSLVVQQCLYVAAMRSQIGSGTGELLNEIWRPVVAAAAMAVILAACGLGWGHAAAGTIGAVRSLMVTCPAGALVYTVTLLGTWFAQGRPDGAERDILHLLGRWYRPVLPARFARPPADPG